MLHSAHFTRLHLAVQTRDVLKFSLIWTAIGVALASLIFLFHPLTTLYMLFTIAVIITEVSQQ